ncbi:CASP-like protein [Pyrus ussuriensis x Pyrus communis]|uniref:CASP-like protein n=1 Tax=Pyrus ussuriensis x Pyrus communis TaxID=2448454 RepID=A0A5N5HK86_9ROSA|nr:CASP-like protein [Pyrus ussuriensis x Pyrus communis]
MAKITKRLCTLVLRLMAVGATLLAAIVMVTSHQRTSIFGISFEVVAYFLYIFFTYVCIYVPVLVAINVLFYLCWYFVIANAIATVYGFLVIFLPSKSQLWRLVVALDVVITILLSSSISAALAIGTLGKNGNSYAGWLPICGQVPKYCDRVKGALISSFVGLIIYVLLLLYAIHSVLDPLLLQKT